LSSISIDLLVDEQQVDEQNIASTSFTVERATHTEYIRHLSVCPSLIAIAVDSIIGTILIFS
jgi:hypothetical protein